MFSVPIPFVSSLLLGVLALQAWRMGRGQTNAWGSWVFFAACAVLSFGVGVRWAAPAPWSDWARMTMPVFFIGLGPLAWRCFAPAKHTQTAGAWRRIWATGWPALLMAVLLVRSDADRYAAWGVEALLIGVPAWFGARLLRLSFRGASAFAMARLVDSDALAQRARWAGLTLLWSAVIDAVVALDFALWRGQHAASLVAWVHILWWPLLAWSLMRTAAMPTEVHAIGALAPSRASAGPEDPPVAMPQTQILSTDTDATQTAGPMAQRGDAEVFLKAQSWLLSTEAFKDPDMTLERMARKLGVPARLLSSAINDHAGRNLSQWVNDHRIAAAQALLRDTDAPVQRIMEDCGFLTKSNFHREFRRVANLTPGEFRASHRAALSPPADVSPENG